LPKFGVGCLARGQFRPRILLLIKSKTQTLASTFEIKLVF